MNHPTEQPNYYDPPGAWPDSTASPHSGNLPISPSMLPAQPKEDSRPQRYGWAPGKYLNHCRSCTDDFIGDKRATICADCAYALPEPSEKSPTQPPELTAERLEELKERYERDSFGPFDYFAFDISIIQDGEERALKGREQDLLRIVYQAFPALRSELATSQKLVESLTEKLDDIREALPDDSPSHRADITGQTMAEDVADLVKANDGFQKLCDDLRLNLSQWREIVTAPKDGSYILLLEQHADAPFIGRWTDSGWTGYKEHLAAYGGWEGAVIEDSFLEQDLTHWMPLPEPPASHSTTAEGESHECS